MPPEIWIPKTAEDEVIDRCRVPTAPGETCGHLFFKGEEHKIAPHMARCVARNHDAIVAFKEKAHPEIMKPWDKDLDRWVSRNRDALIEGRKKLGGGVT